MGKTSWEAFDCIAGLQHSNLLWVVVGRSETVLWELSCICILMQSSFHVCILRNVSTQYHFKEGVKPCNVPEL
jgi:hypothetical protein